MSVKRDISRYLNTLKGMGLSPVADAIAYLADSLSRVETMIINLGKTVNELDKKVSVMSTLINEVSEQIRKNNARLGNISEYVKSNSELIERLEERVEDIQEEIREELTKRVSSLELSIGAIAEVILTRLAEEALEKEGYEITERVRNYRIDNEEIDLLLRTKKDGKDSIVLVEAKVKPKFSDIGSLLAKKDLIKEAIKDAESVTPYPSRRMDR